MRLEVYPAFDPAQVTEAELEADHLQEIAAQLKHLELSGEELQNLHAQEFRYDLCPRCHAQFVKDPLRREASRQLNFSEN